jgi:predicted lipoprotein with Yx(FWY)xxD motif
MKRTLVLVLGVLLSFSSVAALARTGRHPPKAHAASFYTLNIVKTKAGEVLVNTSGSILYEFSRDPVKKDTCVRIKGCVKVWEPMPTTGNDSAGPGVHASLISTVKSLKQITYAGHPLYIYVPAPTHVSAIGTKADGGYWYALNAQGHPVK